MVFRLTATGSGLGRKQCGEGAGLEGLRVWAGAGKNYQIPAGARRGKILRVQGGSRQKM